MFMAGPSGQDREFWNQHDETATPLPDRRHALHDLLLDIPGQDEEEVGFGLENMPRLADRNLHARQVAALLVRTDVDRIGQKLGADAASVDLAQLATMFSGSESDGPPIGVVAGAHAVA